MGGFRRLDPRRLRLDALQVIGDSREYCTIYRRNPGGGAENKVDEFWGRISNVGRQTTGLEQVFPPGTATEELWVLRAPPQAITLKHDDEVRTNSGDDRRWRIMLVRAVEHGQVCILSNIQ